jgi:hypothetical protein
LPITVCTVKAACPPSVPLSEPPLDPPELDADPELLPEAPELPDPLLVLPPEPAPELLPPSDWPFPLPAVVLLQAPATVAATLRARAAATRVIMRRA